VASGFAEYYLYSRRLQTKITRCVIWINIPPALLNFTLVQLDGFGLLPTIIEPLIASWILSLAWLVVSGLHLMLLAEFWEMLWNSPARNAYAESSKMSETKMQGLLDDNRRVVERAFGITGRPTITVDLQQCQHLLLELHGTPQPGSRRHTTGEGA
jgi:hypothetical protein